MPSLTFSLSEFDPLALHLNCCPNGPGFLESQNPNPRTGRYTILPLRTKESYLLDGNGLCRFHGEEIDFLAGDPLTALGNILRERSHPDGSLLFPGGFFGYFGYDLAAWIEELPRDANRDLRVPDLWLAWVDLAAVYDHQRQELTIASLDPNDDLEFWREMLSRHQDPVDSDPGAVTSKPLPTITQIEFYRMVESAKRYISSGDIYQANLSCRFDARYTGSSSALYARLRKVNPSPFGCLIHSPDLDIISCSPERLVSLHGDLAETRPIAGTRPRGFNAPEDDHLATELLGHPKERAEHIMLLDLERNDLGRVCQAGSVEVDELMVLERYSHVTHIVSNVRGRLRDGLGPFDLIRASFPGGTITGVPKKRCMEIIDELEPTGRGTYTGSAGYISVTGHCDLNILIRSFQLIGEKLSYQVGAGIVADSVAENEYAECLAKGEALRKALGVDHAV
ncbi:MAG: aminodeoxychorismate synthase component I [Desulfuromonas sp.]|nr:MAG: aminodeoxychorismate synthase component I [Desulfuromonas sp.]